MCNNSNICPPLNHFFQDATKECSHKNKAVRKEGSHGFQQQGIHRGTEATLDPQREAESLPGESCEAGDLASHQCRGSKSESSRKAIEKEKKNSLMYLQVDEAGKALVRNFVIT